MLSGIINATFTKNILESKLKKLLKDSDTPSHTEQFFTVEKLSFYKNQYQSELNKEHIFFFDIELRTIYLFEGCIHNLEEISRDLSIPKTQQYAPFVISEAFKKYGECFAEKLNGNFSIIIYNGLEQQTLFYKDHLGLQPLAISKKNDQIYFSTNPMAMCKALYRDQKIETAFLVNKFTYEDISGNLMPNAQVLNLKPGHYLKITKQKTEQKKYWFPENIQTNNKLTKQEVLRDLKNLLHDAVTIRVDISKTASAHLSGGLDSGVVAAMTRAAYKHQEQFYGFSWSPGYSENDPDISRDERLFVEKTAQKNNIIPVFSSMDGDSYQSFIQAWQHPREMLYESKTIREAINKNIHLIYSGWGGDEFISIGNRGVDADLIRQGNWKSFLKKYPIQEPRNLLRALIFSALFPSIRRPYSKFKVSKPVYPYLKKTIGSNLVAKKKRFVFHSRRKVHLQLLAMGHLGARAADWYVYGQLYGIEYRYPLLDKRIIEYMMKVPSKCLVGNNNYRILLRELGKDLLPEEVLNNKSKSDPVKDQKLITMTQHFKKQYILEFQDFKKNPDLEFVDFELLEKNIPTILENVQAGIENDGAEIFYYLKRVHEFTKAYHS